MTPFMCAGCQEPIMERFLMKVLDKSWHVQCVKCSECQCLLSEKCFSRENKLYCRSDFFRQYGTQCASCKVGVCPEDLVRRVVNKVYHVECFKCSVCKRQLNTGEQLYLVQGDKFLCDGCYPAPTPPQPTGGVQTISSPAVSSALTSSGLPPYLPQSLPSSSTPAPPLPAMTPQPQQMDKVTPMNVQHDSPMMDGMSGVGMSDPMGSGGDSRKGKTRTSINAKQLEILQATYEKETRPSRPMREEIAAQTGLTAKVIQVWFQNRRSKDKKDTTKVGDVPMGPATGKVDLGL